MNEFPNPGERAETPPGLTVADVLYVVFRHKLKILIIAAGAFCVAAGMIKFMPPPYQSEAKLLIHYVMETKSPAMRGNGPEAQVMSSDPRGESIINTEMEILRSFDLARQVATNIGVERILGKPVSSNAVDDAAGVILKNLMVEAPGKGKVIRIVFQHKDPSVIQPVMRELITNYKSKHVEIHQSAGILDQAFLQRITDIKRKLEQTEQTLAQITTNARIISLDETKKGFGQEMSRIRQELLAAEGELAERKETVKQAEKLMPKTEAAALELGAPVEKVNQYRRLNQTLDHLLAEEQKFLEKGWTEQHPFVKGTRDQIADAENLKAEMIRTYPKLATVLMATASTNGHRIDIAAEMARIAALETRMVVLNTELAKINGDVASVTTAEYEIRRLERERQAQEATYKEYSASLEAARLSDLGAGKITNISDVQTPSPPTKDMMKLLKKVAMVLGMGIFGSVGFAFVVDMYIDRSIRRPGDVRTKIGIPLFLSIPADKGNGHGSRRSLERRNGAREHNGELPSWTQVPGIQPYCEALRDRLLTYFEIKGLVRKPKLVAVTSCSKGAGVTTIATGLAASLSEIGDGNVLLIDMNMEQGAVHPFHRGKPGCALPDVLDSHKRDAALVHDNLYMVSARDVNAKLRMLPKRFTDLFPKFKASDYDYIIFDMPEMSPTSMTPRMARFMDMVLLVIESERSSEEAVKEASNLLVNSEAPLASVLNKTRTYCPKWLNQNC